MAGIPEALPIFLLPVFHLIPKTCYASCNIHFRVHDKPFHTFESYSLLYYFGLAIKFNGSVRDVDSNIRVSKGTNVIARNSWKRRKCHYCHWKYEFSIEKFCFWILSVWCFNLRQYYINCILSPMSLSLFQIKWNI